MGGGGGSVCVTQGSEPLQRFGKSHGTQTNAYFPFSREVSVEVANSHFLALVRGNESIALESLYKELCRKAERKKA